MQSYTEDAPLIHSSPRTSKKSRKRSFDVSDRDAKDDGKQSTENISNHLVLYDPGTSDTGHDSLALTDVMENHTPTFRNFLASNYSGRTFPSIGTFTVQCASCFKWRIIPTKEKYEQIRENILEDPFVCEHAREWRPDILCEDPEDISQDGSRLWAIDKPNIAQPPPGWERLLRIRAEGGTKFADVYYTAPSGKRLRSMVEIQRYLLEHPEYARQGVTLSKFSFQSPRSLQENYVRKRPPRVTNPCDGDMILPRTLEPEEVNPLSWAAPLKEVLIGGQASSSPSEKDPVYSPQKEPTPAGAMSSSEQVCGGSACDQPKMKLEDADHSRNASSFEL
ncbi:methyl-CpG-binding domain-containing protein 2-like [Musa acuminata AAA Group]|uniref:methyl-CpG-binding domain-containing protein 2-like n=1 Tax=Musa acuminata AAA Group TaxID=214697 RepID=UPI0031D1142C